MKHSFYSFSLSVLGICLLFTGEAQAVCDRTAMYGGQFHFSSPGWKTLFGAYTNAQASGGGNCIYDQTEYPREKFLSEQNESVSHAKVESKDNRGNEILSEQRSGADISNFTVAVETNLVNIQNYARGTAKANVVDLILVVNPDGTSSDIKEIPITWCSHYNSDAEGQMGTNYTSLYYADFNFGGENAYYDYIYYEGLPYITHKSNGRICNSGSIKVAGKYSFFTLSLSTWDQGKLDHVPYENGVGKSHNRKGFIQGNFKWTLPSGLKCYSASGKFQGCKPCRYDPHNTTYKSPTLAAIDAIKKAGLEKDVKDFPEDKVPGYEYGGEIYSVPVCPVDAPYHNYDGGYLTRYTYNYKRQGRLGGISYKTPRDVAGWHTHPFPFPECQWYSSKDLNVVKQLFDLYLGLPHRDLAVKLLPKDSDSSCDERVLEGHYGSLKPADIAGYEGNCESMCEQILLEKGIIDAEEKLTY